MNSTQTKILVAVFAVVSTGSLGLTGCSSARMHPSQTTVGMRNPASDEALIQRFVDQLTKESALGSESAVEDAMTQVVNENSDRLAVQKIRGIQDLEDLSEADQKRIMNQLVRLPGFSEKIAVNLDAVQAARREAIESMQDVKGVATEAVQDIHAMPDQAPVTFRKILDRAPELKDDVALMVRENDFIARKTGTSVLGKGCDNIQNEESVQNVATMITGVERDVAAGKASDTPAVAKSLEKNMSYTLGTTSEESHHRVCALSDQGRCAIFSAAMCR